MTKPKGVFKKRKKVFHGTSFHEIKKSLAPKTPPKSDSPALNPPQEITPPSPSLLIKNSINNKFDNKMTYDVVDVEDLSKTLESSVVCKSCGEEITLSVSQRRDSVTTITLKCKGCKVEASMRGLKVSCTVEGKELKLES